MADYMAIFSVTTVIALLALIQFNDAESIETLLDFKNMYAFINCYHMCKFYGIGFMH